MCKLILYNLNVRTLMIAFDLRRMHLKSWPGRVREKWYIWSHYHKVKVRYKTVMNYFRELKDSMNWKRLNLGFSESHCYMFLRTSERSTGKTVFIKYLVIFISFHGEPVIILTLNSNENLLTPCHGFRKIFSKSHTST